MALPSQSSSPSCLLCFTCICLGELGWLERGTRLAWWCCTVSLMAPTAFGDAAIRDWVPALQHISGRGGVRWVLLDLILCSRVLIAGGWTPLLSLVVVGKPGTVVFLRSLLIISFLCTKTGDPSPKITTLRGQETLPCIQSLVAPACSVWGRTISRVSLLDLLISIIVFKASVHPGQSRPGPSTWWMLKNPSLWLMPCLV